MSETILFVLFVTACVMCDIINRNAKENAAVVTAYCLLTICALAVVISLGLGVDVPNPNTVFETAYKMIVK